MYPKPPEASSEGPRIPAYLGPARRPLFPLEAAVERLEALPAGLRVRSLALRRAGIVVAAWVAARPEAPAVSRAAARLARAVDQHVAGGRLAWRALRGGGVVGSDPTAHGWAVAVEGAGLAHQLGWAAADRRALVLAGLVHDVGWAVMPSGEPRLGEHAHAADHLLGLVGPVGARAAAAVRAHHERWDGLGGPLGLHGEAIPRAARALAVVDQADAAARLPSQEPYAAFHAVAGLAGTHLDPALAQAWLALTARRDDRWSA